MVYAAVNLSTEEIAAVILDYKYLRYIIKFSCAQHRGYYERIICYNKNLEGAWVMDDIDHKIAEVKRKIEDVKKRWPFHSPKVALFQELENLELELEELKKQKLGFLPDLEKDSCNQDK